METILLKLLLFISVLLLSLPAQAEHFKYSYFNSARMVEGISQLSVTAICQDTKGYLWLGTHNGLNRYDGNRYTVYSHLIEDSLSLADNQISCLAEQEGRYLWVGTSHGVSRLSLKTDSIRNYYVKDGLSVGGILSVCVDRYQNVWVGTRSGICRYLADKDRFEVIPFVEEKVSVSSIWQDSTGKFWIGTLTKGVYLCDSQFKVLRHFCLEEGTLTGNIVSSLYEDSQRHIWIGLSPGGVCRIDLDTYTVAGYTAGNSALNSDYVHCLVEWKGELIIGTSNRLYAFNLSTGVISQIDGYDDSDKLIEHSSILSLGLDNMGTLWIGSHALGVSKLSMLSSRFMRHTPEINGNKLVGVYEAACCDRNNDVWIGTEKHGLLNYDFQTRKARSYIIPSPHSYTEIRTVYAENDYIWCGTTHGEIYKFDLKARRFELFHRFPFELSVYSILRDSSGNLWVGTSKGGHSLVCFTPSNELLDSVVDATGHPFTIPIRCLEEEKPGVLLVGTRGSGLIRLSIESLDVERRKVVINKPIYYNTTVADKRYKLQSSYISSILRTRNGDLWFSTYGGGFYRLGDKGYIDKSITVKDGLMNNSVCSMVEGAGHTLWMSTAAGISSYSIVRNSIKNYPFSNGIHIREFTMHGGLSLPDSTICFTGNDGFVTFSTPDIPVNTYIPPVVLSEFQVNNVPIKAGDDTGILKCLLDDTEEISLSYGQNNIAISYRALNFINSSMNQYAYWLEGYDKAWNTVGSRTTAYYTKLPAGTYVFHVKASNNDSVWNEEGRTIRLVIAPPVWDTWYARLLYIMLVVAISYSIYNYYMARRRLCEELMQEQREKQLQEEKIRLFTNLAHELRTPLTLIITPFEELIKRVDISGEMHSKLKVIYRNAQRLLLLVNQLMDFQKNQSGVMNLKVSEGDVCEFIREIYYAFKQIAQTNEVNFSLHCQSDAFIIWYDKTLLEKIVFNLLSNAFKYTPSGKDIQMELGYDEKRKMLLLRIGDSGTGIPMEEREKVFLPFYQIPQTVGVNITGTGIGLSLVYSIVRLYKGTIRIEDREDGKTGALFIVELPASVDAFSENEREECVRPIMGDTAFVQLIDSADTSNPQEDSNKSDDRKVKQVVLIVEDDKEVRDYLRHSLETDYNILEAADGEKGYERAVQDFPDLILSDIMMPKKDGLELCAMIKEDMRAGHIPVVLMTARSMVMDIKEGFMAGADDYVVKPFSMEVLRARIHSLLQSRQQLKKLYGKRFAPEVLGATVVSADERFSQKFYETIEKHISNPELSIDTLCQEIGISRANLYRKIKAISELSPTELIRNKRLEIAMKYLKETDMPVSDIASALGFGSHSYFSSSFKALYGMSPTEFVQTKRGMEN